MAKNRLHQPNKITSGKGVRRECHTILSLIEVSKSIRTRQQGKNFLATEAKV